MSGVRRGSERGENCLNHRLNRLKDCADEKRKGCSMCELIAFMETIKTFLIPLIAVVTLCILVLQYLLERNKFKLALFDKRWKYYEVVRDFLFSVGAQGNITNEEFNEQETNFIKETRGIEFVFDKAIYEYSLRIRKLGVNKHQLNESLNNDRSNRELIGENLDTINKKILEEIDDIDDMFRKYMKLKIV